MSPKGKWDKTDAKVPLRSEQKKAKKRTKERQIEAREEENTKRYKCKIYNLSNVTLQFNQKSERVKWGECLGVVGHNGNRRQKIDCSMHRTPIVVSLRIYASFVQFALTVRFSSKWQWRPVTNYRPVSLFLLPSLFLSFSLFSAIHKWQEKCAFENLFSPESHRNKQTLEDSKLLQSFDSLILATDASETENLNFIGKPFQYCNSND